MVSTRTWCELRGWRVTDRWQSDPTKLGSSIRILDIDTQAPNPYRFTVLSCFILIQSFHFPSSPPIPTTINFILFLFPHLFFFSILIYPFPLFRPNFSLHSHPLGFFRLIHHNTSEPFPVFFFFCVCTHSYCFFWIYWSSLNAEGEI